MKMVILGCGRVGARLASLMESDGCNVTIIDSDPASFTRLPESFKGQTVLGTGIDVDVLKSAGIEGADAFAAVTNYDNTNIMACEVAKEIFGVEKVLARIYDPGREDLYYQLGLDTVCPTTLIATTAHDIISGHRHEPASGNGVGQTVPVGDGPIAPGVRTAHSSTSNSAAPVNALQEMGATTQPHPAGSAQPQRNDRGLRGFFRH